MTLSILRFAGVHRPKPKNLLDKSRLIRLRNVIAEGSWITGQPGSDQLAGWVACTLPNFRNRQERYIPITLNLGIDHVVPCIRRSVKQPSRVELLVGFDIPFSFRCQCPEYLSCEGKRGQTICRDNTLIAHRW
jgi:hypothetical protein